MNHFFWRVVFDSFSSFVLSSFVKFSFLFGIFLNLRGLFVYLLGEKEKKAGEVLQFDVIGR